MRARTFVGRATALAVALAATTALTAPPARAVVCEKAPAECQAVLEELRNQPLVCGLVPDSYNPRTGAQAVFCDDPEAWAANAPIQWVYELAYFLRETTDPVRDTVHEARDVVLRLLCVVSSSSCV